uniref:ShKT domain-containing protein n=1 Tax=Callorhinchus milii TaxID=7868 RepID=A0A4W3GB00_CALMI
MNLLTDLFPISISFCSELTLITFEELSTSDSDVQKLVVDVHNKLRRGVKPFASNMMRMEWSEVARKNAQEKANSCTLNHNKIALKYGENLYMSTNPRPWENAMQSWYDEVTDFVYGSGAKGTSVVRHYTQLVWYNSYQIGCAVATCPEELYKYFYVCHYTPPGNVSSLATPYKAGQPCGDCPDSCDNGLCTNTCPEQDAYVHCPALKNLFGCNEFVKTHCRASCMCKNQII